MPEEEAPQSATASSPFAGAAVVGDLALARNVSLRASTMPVAGSLDVNDGREQSVATNGRGLVLYTMNQYAAISQDGGRTFSALNPTGIGLPNSAGGFCCDQLVVYSPRGDRFVWVLQYWRGRDGVRNDSRPNLIRVATATSAELAAFNGALWPGEYYDFTPAAFGLTPARRPLGRTHGVLLDRPFVAFTRSMLHLTARAFNVSPRRTTVGWRLRLRDLGGTLQSMSFGRIDGNHVRPAQNGLPRPAPVQYFAQRATTSRLNVYEWADKAPNTVRYEVNVPLTGDANMTSRDPAGNDWLERLGDQPAAVETGARTRRGTLWFGWMAGRETTYEAPPNRVTIRVHDQPAIEFVGLRKVSVTIPRLFRPPLVVDRFVMVDSEAIEYEDFATAIPQVRANGRGELGVTFMFGGPSRHPSHAVAFVGRSYAQATTVLGQVAQRPERYGDYLGLATDPRHPNCFIAAGSAEKPDIAGNPFADPHYVIFGRRDAGCSLPAVVGRPPGPSTGPVVPPPPPPPPPDLVVDSILSPRNGTVAVTVRNAGTGGAAASKLAVAFAGPGGTGEQIRDTPALAAGESTTMIVPCTPFASITATARADATGTVAESDETNNSRTSSINCSFTR